MIAIVVSLFQHCLLSSYYSFIFFTAPPTTELYTLSLHDALPILLRTSRPRQPRADRNFWSGARRVSRGATLEFVHTNSRRSEEHTSELQSHHDLVCRLLLEKKKKNN